MKTIQQAIVFLPDSKKTVTTMLALTPEQKQLLDLKARFGASQSLTLFSAVAGLKTAHLLILS
jgi:hypothetical protein